jgi:very-short-patch-repair endonuclease
VHRGVYAVGHRALNQDGRWMAAVLAAGDGAVLSHRAGAALSALWPPSHLEVTVGRPRRALRGISVHVSSLPHDEVTAVRNIPVTTLPRTLLDLAAILPPHKVERVVNAAEVRRLGGSLSLADLVERYPRRPGTATIRTILSNLEAGGAVIRSELESRFLAFVRSAGLPAPRMNAHLPLASRWLECDCVWRAQRVVVELDGRAAHFTRAAFERDRARDRMLTAHGWRVVRVTWAQLQHEPGAVAADLRRTLA